MVVFFLIVWGWWFVGIWLWMKISIWFVNGMNLLLYKWCVLEGFVFWFF